MDWNDLPDVESPTQVSCYVSSGDCVLLGAADASGGGRRYSWFSKSAIGSGSIRPAAFFARSEEYSIDRRQ